jgi:hypothetical protein
LNSYVLKVEGVSPTGFGRILTRHHISPNMEPSELLCWDLDGDDSFVLVDISKPPANAATCNESKVDETRETSERRQGTAASSGDLGIVPDSENDDTSSKDSRKYVNICNPTCKCPCPWQCALGALLDFSVARICWNGRIAKLMVLCSAAGGAGKLAKSHLFSVLLMFNLLQRA